MVGLADLGGAGQGVESVSDPSWQRLLTVGSAGAGVGMVLALWTSGAGGAVNGFLELLAVAAVLLFSLLFAASCLVAFLPLGAELLRPVWPRSWRAVLFALLAADLGTAVVLGVVVPFRFGLLSVLLFLVPALGFTRAAVLRSRSALLLAVAALAGTCLLAFPVRVMQQHVAAADDGLPSPNVVQVIDVPNGGDWSSSWDGQRATTVFHIPVAPGTNMTGDVLETVTPGYGDPCGPLRYALESGIKDVTPACEQIGPRLWYRGNHKGDAGFVLQHDGVTVTLTATVSGSDPLTSAGGEDGLRRAILTTHSASPHEMVDHHPIPFTPLGWIAL